MKTDKPSQIFWDHAHGEGYVISDKKHIPQSPVTVIYLTPLKENKLPTQFTQSFFNLLRSTNSLEAISEVELSRYRNMWAFQRRTGQRIMNNNSSLT